MLLRGVKFNPPVLNSMDIEVTRSKAQRSGRSFGGVPFGNGKGRARNQISYTPERSNNPFAAHINPGFVNSMSRADSYFPSPTPPQPQYHFSSRGYYGQYHHGGGYSGHHPRDSYNYSYNSASGNGYRPSRDYHYNRGYNQGWNFPSQREYNQYGGYFRG